MKKAFLTFLTALLILLSSCVTFDGYYYNVDDARAAEKIYSRYDEIFTVEHEDRIVDFIINENKIHISKILCRGSEGEKQFKVNSTSTYSIEEIISVFNSRNDYNWSNTSNFFYKVDFCIVTKGFNDSNNDLEHFNFTYNDTDYHLCYKIYEIE